MKHKELQTSPILEFDAIKLEIIAIKISLHEIPLNAKSGISETNEHIEVNIEFIIENKAIKIFVTESTFLSNANTGMQEITYKIINPFESALIIEIIQSFEEGISNDERII